MIAQPDNGTMCFQDQGYGLENTDYSGTPPPINEPALCAAANRVRGLRQQPRQHAVRRHLGLA